MPKITKKQIREALKGSVKKWERIVRSTKGREDGVGNCPLCELFYWETYCESCPVSKKTGNVACVGTPYDEWSNHGEDEHDNSDSRTPHCPDCLRLAKEELAFLKSLKV